MKRSERLVAMTNFLLEHPRVLISLPYFSEEYGAAKSSISEDLDIVDEMFQYQGIGKLETVAGAAGGVKYIPLYSRENSIRFIDELCKRLEEPERILPGGYLYMSDLLGDPDIIRNLGKIFATAFADKRIEYIVTVATKGIPLAYAVANILNVPVIIVRRDPKVTEGSTVSINYVSGSSRKIQTMVLSKRSLPEGANVCIIDDFMKAGGTITGMQSLLKEFNANVVGIGVLAEAEDEEEERVIDEYYSLIKIQDVDIKEQRIEAVKGNYFTE
ncbi:pur operon repressor [Salinibacillus xinjiangensis]|uniref:Pur operon repressor n=1 Tax=Salinibacillus xinjiangensis TaxID=1229268 RepID=A0A6G1XAY2_9BACI|nr:pur operon repressor [Salinibacillus xinjiangensis]MRG88171.1 pur operon repressor [Salinibacillus xinjiangensis]